METINILNASIKFGTKLFHLTLEKKKSKTNLRKSEEKGEFESLSNESLVIFHHNFKCVKRMDSQTLNSIKHDNMIHLQNWVL